MTILINDIKYSLRQLWISPCFTVVAVLSLALAMGVNTSVFSVINGCLLKRLPVKESHQLREINWTGCGFRNVRTSGRTRDRNSQTLISDAFSYDTYCQFRDNRHGLTDLFALSEIWRLSVVADGKAWMSKGLMVSGNFFNGLGVSPVLGRTLSASDDSPDAEPAAILSYATWRKHFSSDPQVLGKTVVLNEESFVVAGVLPQGFYGVIALDNIDIYVPIASYSRLRKGWEGSSQWCTHMLARLAPDAEEAQICAGLSVLFNQTIRPEMLFDANSPAHKIIMRDASRGFGGAQESHIKSLSILMAIVVIVLVAACMNVAGLALSRGASCQHERAVRTALGAGRWHLIRQSLVETFVITLLGGLLGWVLANWSKATLSRLLLTGDIYVDLRIDTGVWIFSFGVLLGVTLLSGLLPALQAARTNPMNSLKDRRMLGLPRLRLGRALVSIQVGLCLLLLVGAGLFVLTLVNLKQVDTGFDVNNLLVFQLDAYHAGYKGKELQDFYEHVRQDIQRIPGVQAAACSNIPLLSGWMNNQGGIKIPNSSETMDILRLTVVGDFLSTLSIPIVAGRTFTPADNQSSTKVILVNKKLMNTAFPTTDPIYQSLQLGQHLYRIIGIVEDFKYHSIKADAEPLVIFPNQQSQGLYHAVFYVRTDCVPLSLVPGVRKTIARIDSRIPMDLIKTQKIQIAESIAAERLFALLGSCLAVLAVLLVCIGLYGLMAYHVTCRTSEIGIRMALGADWKGIAWPVLRGALFMTATGINLGLLMVLAVMRLIQGNLFGIKSYDPRVLAGSVILLVTVTALAAWIPARRAAKIDPMEALRYE